MIEACSLDQRTPTSQEAEKFREAKLIFKGFYWVTFEPHHWTFYIQSSEESFWISNVAWNRQTLKPGPLVPSSGGASAWSLTQIVEHGEIEHRDENAAVDPGFHHFKTASPPFVVVSYPSDVRQREKIWANTLVLLLGLTNVDHWLVHFLIQASLHLFLVESWLGRVSKILPSAVFFQCPPNHLVGISPKRPRLFAGELNPVVFNAKSSNFSKISSLCSSPIKR